MKLRLTAALLLFAALAFAGEAHWTVPERVQVHAEKVFLADLLVSADGRPAPSELATIFITRAPDPGGTRILTGPFIHTRLQAVGLGDVTVPAEVRIERPGTVIESALGEAAVREYIRQHATWSTDQYEVKILRTHAPLHVDEGEVTARIGEPGPRRLAGQASYQIEYVQNGRRVAQAMIAVEVHVKATVYRAAHQLRHGAVLTETDLTETEVDLANVTGEPITDRSQLVGARVTRTVHEGDVLVAGSVKPAPVVACGEAVMIVAQRGCVMVRAFGIAQQGGAVGDMIKVKNSQSNKVILARVVDSHTVQVPF